MSIEYEEILIKYVEGKLIPGYDWLIKQLESDPEVISGTNRNKENLRKFLQAQVDAIEEYVQAGGEDERDTLADEEVFGDDDIVVSPDSDLDERTDEFFNGDDDEDNDY